MKTNYHTHSNFCDGIQSPEDYILIALERGFSSLGFSSHAPVKGQEDWTMDPNNVENYIRTINELKKKYSDQINIYLGMEIDYIPGENRIKKYTDLGLDYSIGAVHLGWVENKQKWYSFDYNIAESRELIEVLGSSRAFYTFYYSLVRDLVAQGGFNILAHIDLLKKFNKGNTLFFETDEEYINQVRLTLDALASTNILLEINTGAVARGYRNTPYPSQWILEEAFKRNIRVCLNSDCHAPDKIDYFFPESLELIRKAGYTMLSTPQGDFDIRSF